MKNSLRLVIDFAFKHIFAQGGETSKFILMDLLNSILDYSEDDKITKIVYLNPFNDRERESDKLSIMDIKVETGKKELIDIEVQINDADDYRKRSLYYWSKLYPDTIKKGEPYFNFKKSIVINILDFKLLYETKNYHNIFTVMEVTEKFKLNNDMSIHYIELPKFDDTKNVEVMNDLEKWVTFIKDYGNEDKQETIDMIAKRKESIGMAKELADRLSQDEIEYQRYLSREKAIMDELSKKAYMKMQLEKMEEEKLKAEEEKLKVEQEKQKIEQEKQTIEDENKKLLSQLEENIQNNIKLLKSLGITDETEIAENLNIPLEKVRLLSK